MEATQQILQAIAENDTIIIHRHQRPDPDAFGSQVGLAETIRNSYPDKTVLCAGENSPSLAWLATMDDVPVDAYKGALVIVTDTADTPRIDGESYDQGRMLIKIDHHPDDDQYGDVRWVLPDASSTSEVLIDIINGSAGQLKMNAAAARLFYAGMVGDTGRFMYNNTSAHTLRLVAQLYDAFDFGPDVVNQKMSEVTMGQAKLQAFAMSELQITPHGAGYYVIHQDDLKRLGVAADQYQVAVGTGGRLAECRAWAMFTEQPEGNFRVSLRSKQYEIESIAKNHNGGGHALASGAKAADDAEIKQIVNELDALLASAGK